MCRNSHNVTVNSHSGLGNSRNYKFFYVQTLHGHGEASVHAYAHLCVFLQKCVQVMM
jgi:hypothetical protein